MGEMKFLTCVLIFIAEIISTGVILGGTYMQLLNKIFNLSKSISKERKIVMNVFPTMQPVDIGSNPVAQIGMVVLQYILGALGFIVIAVAAVSLLISLIHVFRGKHDKVKVGGFFGKDAPAGSVMLIALGEFVVGMFMVGFFLSGSWSGTINLLINFGQAINNKINAGIKVPTQ